MAESLTGGLLAAALTDVPGASAVFRGGIVAYATELKAALLGRGPRPAGRQGGACRRRWPRPWPRACGTGWAPRSGVATTGVAGPDPAEGKPVGTVYIAASAGR